jgi:hypothetical protein
LDITIEELRFKEPCGKCCAKRIVDEDGVGFIDCFNS